MLVLLRRALAAAALATACNYVLRTIVRLSAHTPNAFEPFGWAPIVFATIAGVAGGTVVYVVLRRFLQQRTNRIFAIVAYACMVLSFATPVLIAVVPAYGYPGTTIVTVLALEIMHATTAVATVIAMTGRATG